MKNSEKYSFKDMTGWDLSDRDDMNGIVVEASCLSNETPNAQVLPPNLTGCTFIDCNLDNVFIPDGNKIINCSQRRFKCQNDLCDWHIDEDEKPIEPLDKKTFEKLGLSTDPKDIPEEKLEKAIVINAMEISVKDKI